MERRDVVRIESNGKRYKTMYIDMFTYDAFGKEYKETKLFDDVLTKYADDPVWMEKVLYTQARNCGYKI